MFLDLGDSEDFLDLIFLKVNFLIFQIVLIRVGDIKDVLI